MPLLLPLPAGLPQDPKNHVINTPTTTRCGHPTVIAAAHVRGLQDGTGTRTTRPVAAEVTGDMIMGATRPVAVGLMTTTATGTAVVMQIVAVVAVARTTDSGLHPAAEV